MSQFKFSTAAFMLGQISCEMIALSSHLNTNGGKKLNGELKEIDDAEIENDYKQSKRD